ncbi:MAG: DMT family transporter [Chlamydiia bacterium]|nr:DMT family transporter [Chlamydiia bacterium]MCP5510229.1 DMT family transporter [Chlamydiales bacterium]HPE84666.1 DMT family transporter [Chlamydiales bacterium]
MQKNVNVGIIFILAATIFGALIGLFGKLGSMETSVPIALFLRFGLPALIVLPGALQFKWHFFHWGMLKWLLLRSGIVFLTQICYFYYLSKGSLINAVLLISTCPLFMPILGRIFLKHKVKKKTVFCLIIGFSGVALILKPTSGLLDLPALVGLCSGLFLACTQLTLHKVTKMISIAPQLCLVFGICAFLSLGVVLAVPGQLSSYVWNDTSLVLIFLALGFSSVCNQILRSLAYRHVNNPSTLAPFMYMTLIFTGILQYFVFKELPDFMSIMGSILIVGAALFMGRWRKRPPVGG